jgi:hypothetical protein
MMVIRGKDEGLARGDIDVDRTEVFGHGSEEWINDAKLVDPVSKGFCCD